MAPYHNVSVASNAFRTQSKEDLSKLRGVVYQCTQCTKHDLQVSICLKTINMLLEKLEEGYTDILDEADPVCRRLYFDKGYKEKRRKPLVKHGDHLKKKSVARTGEVREELKINSASGFSIKLPVLSEPELFGDPQIRWTEILTINPLTKHTVALSGSDSKQTAVVDVRTSRVVNNYQHGLSDVYNFAEHKEHQLYFLGNCKILLFRGDQRMIQLEESFAAVSAVGDASRCLTLPLGVHNYGKGVQIAGPSLYFLSGKGQIVKIDLPLLIRCAENRRTYRSETMPSGTVVDFVAPEKDRFLSISAIGVVSIIESGRVIKQTARLSDKDVFTCIAEIDEKILVVCGNEQNKTSTLRLLGPDLRDIYQHLQEHESSHTLTKHL